MLSIRHISKKVRNSGGRIKGPSKRTKEQDEAFKNTITDKVKK
ncbi:MAG: DUF188 domain-containing protein [Oscillospiraceae bacterium]